MLKGCCLKIPPRQRRNIREGEGLGGGGLGWGGGGRRDIVGCWYRCGGLFSSIVDYSLLHVVCVHCAVYTCIGFNIYLVCLYT